MGLGLGLSLNLNRSVVVARDSRAFFTLLGLVLRSGLYGRILSGEGDLLGFGTFFLLRLVVVVLFLLLLSFLFGSGVVFGFFLVGLPATLFWSGVRFLLGFFHAFGMLHLMIDDVIDQLLLGASFVVDSQFNGDNLQIIQSLIVQFINVIHKRD